MKIRGEQMVLINSLRCERLSSNEENFRLIDSFYSAHNDNVAKALRDEAYQEDESGIVAYYVVKDADNNVLFFFSLKCGLLFDEFIEGEKLTIVPKIFELRKIVGCEYLFLFAADCDPDEHLVNYYSQKLKFKKADEHSTAMEYDKQHS